MYSDIEVLLSPLIVSSITGTTLSLTIYSWRNSSSWGHPSYFVLAAATSFILSFFSTIFYIIFQNKFLLMPISLGLLAGGGLLILISIIYLIYITLIDDVAFRLKKSKQFPELYHE